MAIDFCLKEAGISLSDVDVIAIAHDPWTPFTKFRFSLIPSNFFAELYNLAVFTWYSGYLKKMSGAKVVYVSHHLAHAATAYYCSGFDEANVLTVDGSGET